MPRLTNSTSRKTSATSSTRKPVQPQEAEHKGGAFTFTFEAPFGHVSTGKTLAAFKGRQNGGVDMYIPLALLAQELGYLPADAEITVTVKAKGKAETDPECAVPKTSQHLFSKGDSHTWSEVYSKGGTFGEYMAALAEGPQEEAKPAKPERKPGKLAAAAQEDGKPTSKAGESLLDARMTRLEDMIGKLASAVLKGK